MLSIIIPAYKSEGTIKPALDSLDSARHPGTDMEIIVVDDNSGDGIAASVTKYYPFVNVIKNSGTGRAAAMNTGLAAARGAYIVYLEPTAKVGEKYFTDKIQHLQNNAACDACYGRYERLDKASYTTVQGYSYPMYSEGTRYAREHLVNHLGGDYLPQSTIVWKRDVLLRRKGHNESINVHEDVELLVRSIFNGLRITAIAGDSRVYLSNTENADPDISDADRWRQIVKLRKKMFADLKTYSFEEDDCFLALSSYLFECWKKLRRRQPELAVEFLEFAKKVYWPIPVKGGAGHRLLSMLLGPERATELTDKLLKKD